MTLFNTHLLLIPTACADPRDVREPRQQHGPAALTRRQVRPAGPNEIQPPLLKLEACWKDGKMVIWGEKSSGTWIKKGKAGTRQKARKSDMEIRLAAGLR